MSQDWDLEMDVIVVGAGGCGMAAALAAYEEGAEVAVLEKSNKVIGNTGLSTGSVPGAGTRFQKECGIDDSAAKMVEDLLRKSGKHEAEYLTERLAYESADLVEWLVDYGNVRLELITDYKHVGHSVPRLHAPKSRKGQDLVDDMVKALGEREIPIALSNPVRSLVKDEAGAIIGVETEGSTGERSRLKAKKVILACCGFGADRELLKEYCPEISEAQYFGFEWATGEALKWGKELGAALANMGAYQGYAVVSFPFGSILSWTSIEMGGIVVSGKGKRFGDESVGYSDFTKNVLKNGIVNDDGICMAYVIFDSRIKKYIENNEEEFRDLVELGGVKTEESIAKLCSRYNINEANMQETLEAYNRAAKGEKEDKFGRKSFGLAPLEAPYAICQVTPGLFHTQGGLKIDRDCRVLRKDDTAVKNLFAGGGAAAGISGKVGPAGYSSGNGLLSAIGLGRIAGRAAAREIKEGK